MENQPTRNGGPLRSSRASARPVRESPGLQSPGLQSLSDAALEVAPQALVIAEPGGRVLRMNRRARRLLAIADATAEARWPGTLSGLSADAGSGWRDLPLGTGGTAPFWLWSRPLPGDRTGIGGGEGGPAVLHALWPCRVSEKQAHAAGDDEAGYDEMMAVLVRHALLGEMGGALAHQMSQPLNIIRLTAERAVLEAEAGRGGAGEGDRFARLADQAEALFETVALVQGAPAISGPGDLQPVDLGPIMKQAANLARGPLRAAGLKPDVLTPPDMPRAWGEPMLLLQIGFAVLTVLAEAVGGAATASGLVVRVDPEGQGGAGRLVVDMTRGEAVEHGTPLMAVAPDLTLSRRIVLAALALAGLGGHLLMLVDDQGALLGVRLDLARVTGRRPGTGAVAGRLVDDPRRGVRILLVEDEPEAADEVVEYMRGHDYDVDVADTVRTALKALDSGTYDVLVTDVAMKGGGARTILGAATAAHPEMAFIIASGFAIDTDATFADLASMSDAILRKPYSLAELRDAVVRVLGG